MDIFLFNRKLMWAVIPLVFWSLFVLFGALDNSEGGKDGLAVRLERRAIRLAGRPLSITEDQQGNLSIELGVLREQDGYAVGENGRKLPDLPDGLKVSYTVEGPDHERRPPEISLRSGENEPLSFMNGHMHVLIAEKFIVRMSRQGVQVLPKGPEFDQRKFLKELLERRGRGAEDGRGPIRPPDGMQDGRRALDRMAPQRNGGSGMDRNPPPDDAPGSRRGN
ncbi:hypothetical protein KDL29_01685 [bacterium]|nr:hypothetical protein [bacterium]